MNGTPSSIGPYPVEREIGRGGMGIVYLGRDPRLERPVALKVLPDPVAHDPERLARFEREAKLLASLRHPNIAGIYGIEESDGHRFLALEYVDGETLAERISRHALPLNEALEVCRQIASALEAAHESGVIHRDLKPGNVKLTSGGEVKVLDFGLAKGDGAATSASEPGLSHSPTLTFAATGVGVILGTAAYMSPEQARGKAVDRRTDIWSFGCVLYECLTGKQAFVGETVSDTIAKILEREPDWSALPNGLPARVRELLQRCLEKDAKRRLRDMGDARIELEESLAASGSTTRGRAAPEEEAPALGRSPVLAWAVAGVLALTVAALGLPRLLQRAPAATPMRFAISPPENVTLSTDAAESAISPDGRMIAFTAVDSAGNAALWLRPLESLAAHVLAGSENAALPTWSPDSREIAFFADGKLKKVPVSGGAAEALCDANNGRGAAWSREGVIVFAPAGEGPLFKVSVNGGTPAAVTSLDTTRRETGHRFPCFLPDGRHFLYVSLPARQAEHEVFVGSIDSKRAVRLMTADGAPVYVEPGYLLYRRNGRLVAQRFDPRGRRLKGEPVSLTDSPGGSFYSGHHCVSASSNGMIQYLSGQLPNTELHWLDRSGQPQGRVSVPAARYESVNISPDGERLAVVRRSSPSSSDLWLVELARGVATRFTFAPGQVDNPVWSPDGGSIAFESNRNGPYDLYLKSLGGSGEDQPLFTSPALFKHPFHWSKDGAYLVFEQLDQTSGWDIWVLPMTGDRKPSAYLNGRFNERWAHLSPDGKWMSYTSDESGKFEVYVQSFPIPTKKYQVSTGGGAFGTWRNDSKEMFYGGPDGQALLAVDVNTSPEFHAGVPRLLFKAPNGYTGLVATPDHQRFLVALPAGGAAPASLTVAMNWDAALGKR